MLEDRTVQLHRPERVAAQRAGDGVARAEVVQRHADAHRAEAVHGLQCRLVAGQPDRVRHLDLEAVCRRAGRVQHLGHHVDVTVFELARARVDGDAQGRLARRLAGRTQDDAADLVDRSVLDGERDEGGGLDLASCRMRPAGERLQPHRLSAAHGDDALEGHADVAIARRLAQVARQGGAVLDGAALLALEGARTASPILLGAVERDVGVAQQVVEGLAVERQQREAGARADAHPHRRAVALHVDGLGNRLDEARGQRLHRVRIVLSGQEQGELVPAQPGQQVVVAQATPEAIRQHLQQRVADTVAVRVVDRLEAVQIEHDQRAGAAVADVVVHLAVEGGAVEQAGERIVPGEVRDLALLGAAFRQVAHGGDLSAVLQWLRHDLDGQSRAVVAQQLALVRLARHRVKDEGRLGEEAGQGAALVLVQPRHLAEARVAIHDLAPVMHHEPLEGGANEIVEAALGARQRPLAPFGLGEAAVLHHGGGDHEGAQQRHGGGGPRRDDAGGDAPHRAGRSQNRRQAGQGEGERGRREERRPGPIDVRDAEADPDGDRHGQRGQDGQSAHLQQDRKGRQTALADGDVEEGQLDRRQRQGDAEGHAPAWPSHVGECEAESRVEHEMRQTLRVQQQIVEGATHPARQ